MEDNLGDLLGHLSECLEDMPDLAMTTVVALETASEPPCHMDFAAETPPGQDYNAPTSNIQVADPPEASTGHAADWSEQDAIIYSHEQLIPCDFTDQHHNKSAFTHTNSTARDAWDISTAKQPPDKQVSNQPQAALAKSAGVPVSSPAVHHKSQALLGRPYTMNHSYQASPQLPASPWQGSIEARAATSGLAPHASPATTLPTAGPLEPHLSALDGLPALQLDGRSECRQPAAATPSQALQQQQQLDCSGLGADLDMQLECLQPQALFDIIDQLPDCIEHVQWQMGSGTAVQEECRTPLGSYSCCEQASASAGGMVHSQPVGEREAMHTVSVNQSLSMLPRHGTRDSAGQLVQAEGLQTRSSMLDSLPALGLDGTPVRCHPSTPHMDTLATSANVRRQEWSHMLQQAEPGAYVPLATAGTPLEQQQSTRLETRQSFLDSLPDLGLDGTPVVATNAAMPGSLSTTANTAQALTGRLQTCQTSLHPLSDYVVTNLPLSAPAAASCHGLQRSQGPRAIVREQTLPLAKELFPIMEEDGQEGTRTGLGQPLGDPATNVLSVWCAHEDELDELDLYDILPARHMSETAGHQVGHATQRSHAAPALHTAGQQGSPPTQARSHAQSPEPRSLAAEQLNRGLGRSRPARSASASRQLLRGNSDAQAENAAFAREEHRPTMAPVLPDAAATSSSKQSFSGQDQGKSSKAACPQQQVEAGQESCVHTASSSKREASSRDRKVILQLRPRDNVMREAMVTARLNPQLELTCGAKKEVMAVVSHLQTRWASSSPSGPHTMRLFPPESLPALAGLSWGIPDLHKTLTVMDLHTAMGCPDMLALSYAWIPDAGTSKPQYHQPQLLPGDDVPFAVKARSLVTPYLPLSKTRRTSKPKATSVGTVSGAAESQETQRLSGQSRSSQQCAQAGNARIGASVEAAQGSRSERKGLASAAKASAAETSVEYAQATELEARQASASPAEKVLVAVLPASSMQKLPGAQQLRKSTSGKPAGEQRPQLIEVQSQQKQPASAKRRKAVSTASIGGGAASGEYIKSPARKRSRKRHGENVCPSQAADCDGVSVPQAMALPQPRKGMTSMAAQRKSSPASAPGKAGKGRQGLQCGAENDLASESEDEYQPNKALQSLYGRRPTTRSLAGCATAMGPCLTSPGKQEEGRVAPAISCGGVEGSDLQVDLSVSGRAVNEEATCDGFEGWAAFSRATMAGREGMAAQTTRPLSAGPSLGPKDISLSAWTAEEATLPHPLQQKQHHGTGNARPAGLHTSTNEDTLDVDMPLDFEDFLGKTFLLELEDRTESFTIAGCKPFQEMFSA